MTKYTNTFEGMKENKPHRNRGISGVYLCEYRHQLIKILNTTMLLPREAKKIRTVIKRIEKDIKYYNRFSFNEMSYLENYTAEDNLRAEELNHHFKDGEKARIHGYDEN